METLLIRYEIKPCNSGFLHPIFEGLPFNESIIQNKKAALLGGKKKGDTLESSS